MAMKGYLSLCMPMLGCVCLCWVVYAYVGLCMAMKGYLLLCMPTLHTVFAPAVLAAVKILVS